MDILTPGGLVTLKTLVVLDAKGNTTYYTLAKCIFPNLNRTALLKEMQNNVKYNCT